MIRQLSSFNPGELAAIETAVRESSGPRVKRLHELYTKSLLPHLMDWGQHFFPNYFKAAPSLMHHDIAKALQWRHRERGIKEARIAPRGGAKTTWTSKLYTLFCICHRLEDYILLIGDSSEQAYENLEAVRNELESNERLAGAYPSACGVGPKWNQSQIVTRNGIKVHAAGTRKKVRGRSHRSARPSLIIIDDLENDEAVQSAEQRRKTWNWLTRALLPAGDPSTNVLFVGTALHPDDALQNITKQSGWRFQSFAALIHEPKNLHLWEQWRLLYRDLSVPSVERDQRARKFYEDHKEEMNFGAKLLWPEWESLYYLMCWRETNGEQAFQAEKQGNAAATGATEFSSDLFSSSIWFDVWPDLSIKAMALDPSKGQNEKNDYSAYVWGGLGADGNIYVDADLERRDASKVVADGIRIYRQFRPQLFGLETVMFLQLFEELFSMEARRQGIVLPITQINPHEQKLIRIRQLTPYLTRGRIRFRAGSRGAEMLVDQLKYFPTYKHDDGPDALHMLIELLVSLSVEQQAGGGEYGDEFVDV